MRNGASELFGLLPYHSNLSSSWYGIKNYIKYTAFMQKMQQIVMRELQQKRLRRFGKIAHTVKIAFDGIPAQILHKIIDIPCSQCYYYPVKSFDGEHPLQMTVQRARRML